jgi:sigma-E factor negative regulatory protein RseA
MKTRDDDLEALSALMDGETQELELRRLLGSIDADPALRERWRRQQMISDIMSKRPLTHPDMDVSGRVSDALSAKSSVSRNPIWSVAVAASVTLAVVMGGQQLLLPTGTPAAPFAVSEVGGAVVPIGGAQPVQASLDAQPLQISSQRLVLDNRRSAEAAATYERLATDRYRKLSVRHSAESASAHPSPFIPQARVAEFIDEASSEE